MTSMQAPLVTTVVGDAMQDAYDNACEESSVTKAFWKGFGLGVLDYFITLSTVIGASVLTVGTFYRVKNKITKK